MTGSGIQARPSSTGVRNPSIPVPRLALTALCGLLALQFLTPVLQVQGEVRDAQTKGISHWLVIPCLLLTFMLGPTGLALYLVIRTVKTRDTTIYSPA